MQTVTKGRTLEKFRNQIGGAVVSANVVDDENIGVIERARGSRFLLEAPEVFRITI
jgi:hypothetical protein